jgi:hypothetical protein
MHPGSKTIEEEVKKEEKYIMALSEDECLQQLSLKCTIDKKIKGIPGCEIFFAVVEFPTYFVVGFLLRCRYYI